MEIVATHFERLLVMTAEQVLELSSGATRVDALDRERVHRARCARCALGTGGFGSCGS
jgi:hypothetical protein